MNPPEKHTHTDVAAVIRWSSCSVRAATAITHWTSGGTRFCLFLLSDDSHLASLGLRYSTTPGPVHHTLWLYIYQQPVRGLQWLMVTTRRAWTVSETQGIFHTSSAFDFLYSHLLGHSGGRPMSRQSRLPAGKLWAGGKQTWLHRLKSNMGRKDDYLYHYLFLWAKFLNSAPKINI